MKDLISVPVLYEEEFADYIIQAKIDYILDFVENEDIETILGKERFETIDKFLDYYEKSEELESDYVDQCFCVVYFCKQDHKRIHISTLCSIIGRSINNNPEFGLVAQSAKQNYKCIFPCDDMILEKAITLFWSYCLNKKFQSNIIDGCNATINMPTFHCRQSEMILPIIHKIESGSFLDNKELDIILENKSSVFKLLHFRSFCHTTDERLRLLVATSK